MEPESPLLPPQVFEHRYLVAERRTLLESHMQALEQLRCEIGALTEAREEATLFRQGVRQFLLGLRPLP